MNQRENLTQRLARLKNIRDPLEEALDHARGIEDDYRRGSLEAHIRGALREINTQRAELVSDLSIMQRNGHVDRARSKPHLASGAQETGSGTPPTHPPRSN
jgi:hypothetical protein